MILPFSVARSHGFVVNNSLTLKQVLEILINVAFVASSPTNLLRYILRLSLNSPKFSSASGIVTRLL